MIQISILSLPRQLPSLGILAPARRHVTPFAAVDVEVGEERSDGTWLVVFLGLVALGWVLGWGLVCEVGVAAEKGRCCWFGRDAPAFVCPGERLVGLWGGGRGDGPRVGETHGWLVDTWS